MTKVYMVRQPIMDKNQNILGYEILYNSNAKETSENAEDMTVESFITQAKADAFLDNEAAFLTFSPNLLFRKVPEMFDPKKLVIQIDETTMIFPEAKQAVLEYRNQGYQVAIQGFEFTPRHFSCMDMIDYIKLNFMKDISSYDNILLMAEKFGKEVIAYNVNSDKAMTQALDLGVKYMQGTNVGKPKKLESNAVEFLQSNFLQFLVEITKEEPDMDTLEQIISRDVSLTYSLVRLVNSAYFSLRSKATTVKEALVVLGIKELKKWVYLLSFKNTDGTSEVPTELVRTSFLRGNFSQALVGQLPNIGITPEQGYLMGMFSTLDLLTGIPLHMVLDELSMPDVIKEAVVQKKGDLGKLFKLMLSYESGNWAQTTELSEELGLNMEKITEIYFVCVEDVNKTWHELMAANKMA